MFWNLDVLGLDVLSLDVLILDVLGYHRLSNPVFRGHRQCLQIIKKIEFFNVFTLYGNLYLY
jgi:hypothetical protein